MSLLSYQLLYPAMKVFRAGGGIRTPDRLITNQLLYQLSYTSNLKVWVVQSTTQLAGTLIRGIAPHWLSQ